MRLPRAIGAVLVAITISTATFAPPPPAAADRVADKRAEARRLADRLEVLGARMSELAESYNEARLAAESTSVRLLDARAQLDAVGAQQRRAHERLKRAAVDAYMRGGPLPVLPKILGGDAADLLRRRQYVEVAAHRQRDELDAFRRTHADLLAERADLEAAQARANADVARVEEARAATKAAADELQATYSRVQGEVAQLVQVEEARRRAEAERQARDAAARRARERAAQKAKAPRSASPPPAAPAPSSGAAAAVEEARRQIGKPYEWGADGPESFDCSGLTQWAWRAGGRSLPHSSRAQFSGTRRVAFEDIAPGDLLFYGSPIHHVGIYVGNGQMIAAPETGRNVGYFSIHRRDYAGAGRP